MTGREVQQVLAYLAAAYPNHQLTDATVAVYRDELEAVETIHAVKAAQRIVRTERWFPTIARLLEEIRAVKRADEPTVHALEQPRVADHKPYIEGARKILAEWRQRNRSQGL